MSNLDVFGARAFLTLYSRDLYPAMKKMGYGRHTNQSRLRAVWPIVLVSVFFDV